jgi:hypothetical protein
MWASRALASTSDRSRRRAAGTPPIELVHPTGVSAKAARGRPPGMAMMTNRPQRGARIGRGKGEERGRGERTYERSSSDEATAADGGVGDGIWSTVGSHEQGRIGFISVGDKLTPAGKERMDRERRNRWSKRCHWI